MRIGFRGSNVPFMSRSHRFQVLGPDRIQGATPFNLVPLNPSQDTNIIRRIDIDTQIEQIPQFRTGKY